MPGLAASAQEPRRALLRCRAEAEGEDRRQAFACFFPGASNTWMAGTSPAVTRC